MGREHRDDVELSCAVEKGRMVKPCYLLVGIDCRGVNRRSNLTPYRRPVLTPLSGGFWR